MTEQSQVVALAAVPRTPRERFLDALEAGLSIAAAARAAGVGRQTVYDWRRREPEFGTAWDAAVETGTDRLEDEAHKRALGQSDTLMIFLLKARRPEKFKERYAAEHTGKGGDQLMAERFPKIADLSLEELTMFERLMSKACGIGLPGVDAEEEPPASIEAAGAGSAS